MKHKLLSAALLIFSSYCASAKTVMITAGNFQFSPSNTTLNLGDTVMFMWHDDTHTTTSTTVPAGAATWDSPLDATHTSFIYVPTVAGTYTYHCIPHASMGMTGQFSVQFATMVPTVDNPVAFMFWPNPATSSTHIRFAQNQPAVTINVTDIIGNIILTHDYSDVSETDLDLSHLPQGRYLLYATDGNILYTENLIVSR